MSRLVFLFMLITVQAQAETTAILNVNVIPMGDSTVLQNQTVIVENGWIKALGPVEELPVPAHSRTIDGTDRFLLPGLVEMHAHVARAGSRNLESMLDLFVANGVTTIRGMLGHPTHLQLREQLNRHEILGPRLITSGPSLNGNSVDGVADGVSKVRRQAEAGYDFLKLHPGLTADEFSAIASTANELQMPFSGHVSQSVGLEKALAAGMASIDHLDGYMTALLYSTDRQSDLYGGFFGVMLADKVDAKRIATIVQRTKSSGTWIVPTQSLIEGLASEEPATKMAKRFEMQYMPANTVAGWEQSKRQLQSTNWDQAVANQAIDIRREILRQMLAADVNLLLGSDAPQVFNVPGFSAHRELQLLVDIGFTPYQAIETATSAAGEFLQLPLGQIRPGYSADLILLDDNPLADIGHLQRIHGVMVRGSWIAPAERRALLEKHRRRR